MPQYKTLYDLSISGRGAGRKAFETEAVKNQRNVGALGGSLKANPEVKSAFKEWTTDQGIDEKSKTIPGSQRTYNDPSGKLREGGRVEQGKNEWGPKGQPKASEQLKVGSKWTPENIAAVGQAATSVLNTLDMLTGGQDTIIPGSGYAMQHAGYNPEMYIGRGMGY